MSRPIYLKLDTYDGIITIPFLGLEEVDYFTVMYSDVSELVSSLIKLLKLDLDLYEVTSVYLTEDKYNRGKNNKCFPIKCSKNNYNVKSLEKAFVNYLKNNPKRIFDTSIRYMNIERILRYFDTGILDIYELERIVRDFFANKASYSEKRKIYFLIVDMVDRNRDENITIDIDPVDYKISEEVDRENLSIYSLGGDDHLNDLIEFYRRYPELRDKIIDEIVQYDNDEVRRYLNNEEYGIVDGVSRISKPMKIEKTILEETTGLSIDNLRANYVKKRRHRR